MFTIYFSIHKNIYLNVKHHKVKLLKNINLYEASVDLILKHLFAINRSVNIKIRDL